MSTGFFYGQIVRIRVARHGKEKIRPVVIVTPNEAMGEGEPLVGVKSPTRTRMTWCSIRSAVLEQPKPHVLNRDVGF
jgi:hypothetical protein